MDRHGIARTSRTRTEEQRKQDLEKIAQYRALDDQLREKANKSRPRGQCMQAAQDSFDADALALTSKLLRANPEYYTAWNVRRRCLTCGSLFAPSRGSWPSKGWPSSSATATGTLSSAGSSTSSSTATRPSRGSPTTGTSGTTASSTTESSAATAATAEVIEGEEKEKEEDEKEEEGKREARRRRDVETLIRSELAFTMPLLVKFPKCYWIWNHRLWTLQQAVLRQPVEAARAVWEEELGLVSKMLTRDRRNFHAWGYRRTVVARLEGEDLGGSSMAEDEFRYTRAKIGEDLSNFSAWHNRSQLMPRLLRERGANEEARTNFFDDELNLVREGLNVGPEDQSLWYYHQFLVRNLAERDPDRTVVPHFSTEDRARYLGREMDEIRDLLEDYEDVKWIYEALLDYALTLARIEGGRELRAGEKTEVAAWLAKLAKLDPMRNGRWRDLSGSLGVGI